MAASASALSSGTLPIPRPRLIGREAEIAAARTLLLDDAVPLLTLTGPGGVGKTRLALALAADVADRFADGTVWVDLAPLVDPALAPTTVARALGITPASEASVVEEIVRSLRSRQLLLLLDNCEHALAETAGFIAGVLAACPAVQTLATSRAPLRVQAEREFPVMPLPVPARDTPADGESLGHNAAIRLFVERARAIDPDLATGDASLLDIADICHCLDGLPLAIELAAARVRTLAPADIRVRLDRRLPLLTGGRRDAPTR